MHKLKPVVYKNHCLTKMGSIPCDFNKYAPDIGQKDKKYQYFISNGFKFPKTYPLIFFLFLKSTNHRLYLKIMNLTLFKLRLIYFYLSIYNSKFLTYFKKSFCFQFLHLRLVVWLTSE